MKKFLSLVLALVMTMSLVTISAGAKDFDDNADITYVEAVDVMSEIGIVDGDKSGNFNPTNGLTRGAAAKIICNLILGPTTAAELNADTDPYPDVAQDSTFGGYIAYCQKEGIISGYADGTFKPANPLTGYAFMKMLLGALGYDPAVEGYTGANWSINVAKQAIGIGLNTGLKTDFNGSDFVTREEAMLYAFNTLKATMVDYDTTIAIGDVTVAGSNEYEVANNAATEGIKNDNKMQFAEKYFSKLKVAEGTDDFGRPVNEWTYNKKTVGSYVDYTLMVAEFTTKVTGKDLYNALGASIIKNNELVAYVDGEDGSIDADDLGKAKTATLLNTGNGVLTQVFFDNDEELITVAVINTYLAEADNDYSEKTEDADLTIYGMENNVKEAGKTEDASVSSEDFALVEEIEDGDFYLVTYANDAVQSIVAAEVVDDVNLKSFKNGTSVTTTDGDTYTYADSADYADDVLDEYSDANMKETTYKVYLDQYGYLIGIEIVEDAKNYVFVTGYESFGKVLSSAKADAFAIFPDGTTATITVKDPTTVYEADGRTAWKNAGQSNVNAWYSYTTDKNDNYVLTLVTDDLTATEDVAQSWDETSDEINKSHVSLISANDGRVYGNDDTVYIDAKVKVAAGVEQITGVSSVTTGVKNMNYTLVNDDEGRIPDGAYILFNDDYYVIAAVIVGEDEAMTSNYAYIIDEVEQEDYDAESEEWTWHRAAIVAGEKVILKEVSDSSWAILDDEMVTGKWYEIEYDADGMVVDATEITIWDMTDADNVWNAQKMISTFNAESGFDKEDVSLLWNPMAEDVTDLTMVGHTLYIAAGSSDYGVDIAPDANAVLMYTLDKKDYIDYYADDAGNVKDAIADMDATSVDGDIYFLMEDGVATTVIIISDEYWTTKNVGTGTTSSEAKTIVLGAGKNVALRDKDGNDVEGTVTLYVLRDNGYVKVISLDITATTSLADYISTGTYKVTCGDLEAVRTYA